MSDTSNPDLFDQAHILEEERKREEKRRRNTERRPPSNSPPSGPRHPFVVDTPSEE